jgi:hypothetical protein
MALGVLLCLGAGASYCQVNQWPPDLKVFRDTALTVPESSAVTFVSGQRQYLNTFDNADTLRINQNDSLHAFRQLAAYSLEKNELFGSRKQYFDLSGTALKKNVLFPGMSLGVDWTPIFLLNSQDASQGALGSLDAGPVARFTLLQVPITLRGGVSGKIENDSLPMENFRSMHADDFGQDHGYYGAFDLGRGDVPIGRIPLFINAQGYFRSMKTYSLLSGTARALFYKDLPTGDTLSVLYTDSLINGSDALMGEEGIYGKSFYLNVPDRIERSYEIKGGIKGKYRFSFQPAFVYSFSRYSLMYPSLNAVSTQQPNLGDRRNTDQSVAFLLGSDPSFYINYSGGLRVDWEREEKLFGSAINMSGPADSSNLDTLKVKLNDYTGYTAAMDHTLSVQSKSGRGVVYSFDISRYSKTFSNTYNYQDSIYRNYNDQDWIVQSHHLDITPLAGDNGKFTVSGTYSTNLRYYLKAQESAYNSVDYIYTLGMSATVKTSETFNLHYGLSGTAKRTEYEFPVQYAQVSTIPPYYSRGITSDLTLNFKIAKSFFLCVELPEHYQDEGAWYTDTISQKTDSTREAVASFYGIQRKQWNYRTELTVGDTAQKHVRWQCGSSFERIIRTKFDADRNAFVPDLQGTKYVIVPFVAVNAKVGDNCSILLKLKRYIDTIDNDYWDFTLLFTAGF